MKDDLTRPSSAIAIRTPAAVATIRRVRRARAAELAGTQHGVVSRAQLLDLGFSPGALDRAVRDGHLHRMHRGVYAVGLPVRTWRGRLMAAVLAAGPGAVVSHRSAAQLHGLLPGGQSDVHVSAARDAVTRPGIRGHRSRRLSPEEVTRVDGIPVTSVARTLLDVAGDGDATALERAWRRGDELGVLDARAITRQLQRGRSGAAALREVAREAAEGSFAGLTRSELELVFFQVVRVAGLPAPETNVPMLLAGRRVELDALWRAQRVVVELDGWKAHRTRAAFEADRRRDADLVRLNFRPLRFTWTAVIAEPLRVVAVLRDVLTATSSMG